jgi:glucose-1-phosphate thymidylyltransferase
MKGIILSGGQGTRLFPITKIVCKQLLPVYDKPMIYYPLSVLMLAGIRDILIISTPQDLPRFQQLFGSGEQLGLRFSYKEQAEPRGIAEAFLLGEKFIGDDEAALILGDNIFYGHSLPEKLRDVVDRTESDGGATIFGYYVKDPERYGVVSFDREGRATKIEEKPDHPQSNYAVAGLYFYDRRACSFAHTLRPSARGELEITDLNNCYLQEGALKVELLGRGFAWLDTGTHTSLVEATSYIKTIEERQGLKISCIEEIAYTMGYIDLKDLEQLARPLMKSGYGDYLMRIVEEHPNVLPF